MVHPLRKWFTSPACRQARPSVRPRLEELETRALLSASSLGSALSSGAAPPVTASTQQAPTQPGTGSTPTTGALKTQSQDAVSVHTGAQPGVTDLLPIPPRQQWNENNGYCGETSVQSIALYYGTYVSQLQVRAMINPNQQDQLLVGSTPQDSADNLHTVLNDLHLTYQYWNGNSVPTGVPQGPAYLNWAKQEIQQGAPVIGTLYVRGGTDPNYDHIVPFVGFQSSGSSKLNDSLIFNDNFQQTPITRPFATLPASRIAANHSPFEYSVPLGTDYGAAVTGIVDPNHQTVPVHLSVNQWNEPNIVPVQLGGPGQQPVTLQGTLTATSLVPGQTYHLLRYDNYQNVPTSNFVAAGGYTWDHTFTATSTTQTFTDTFSSAGDVIYRCVPASGSSGG